MRVAVIGSTGQLGSDVVKVFGKDAVPLSHKDIELKDIENCRSALRDMDAVVNCAAFVNVDACEEQAQEAFAVNALGAKNVAMICEDKKIANIYISTDFVFDGSKGLPYKESDHPNPINTYGISKYAGEILIRNLSSKHYILRAAAMFGAKGSSGKGGNFIDWMITKSRTGEQIRVIDDIFTSFTYTKDAAVAIKHILEKRAAYGTYHIVNSGYSSWFGLAEKIFEDLRINQKIIAIKSKDWHRRARVPKFSVLNTEKLGNTGLIMRSWEQALADYLAEKGYVKGGV